MKKLDITGIIILFIPVIILVIMLIYKHNTNNCDCNNNTTPVEKNVIDTLYLTRDNIITKVKYLDSIKYDTIEKIYVLNDTASVELFYKLVSE